MRKAIEDFISPIKHHLLTAAFVLGFVVDNFTLVRIDRLFDSALLASYLVIAMLGILCMYIGAAGKWSERFTRNTEKYAPLVIQYTFGGLMSGVLVFYSRSGSWFTSWPYLLVIIAIILGNELIKKRAQRLVFNLSVFFVGLFSYSALIVPVVLGKMGDLVFISSGIGAFIIMMLFIKALFKIVPNFMALNTRSVFFSIGMIYFGLNGLYFANLIPPIPLSLKAIGVYHSVEKLNDGSYRLAFEQGQWYEILKESDNIFHMGDAGRVYCYASVYAPLRLTTTIYHRWEYYDATKGAWTYHARIPYPISGGRISGYRGSTYVDSVREGKWRCSVETERGQVVGRDVFTVRTDARPDAIVTRVDI